MNTVKNKIPVQGGVVAIPLSHPPDTHTSTGGDKKPYHHPKARCRVKTNNITDQSSPGTRRLECLRQGMQHAKCFGILIARECQAIVQLRFRISTRCLKRW